MGQDKEKIPTLNASNKLPRGLLLAVSERLNFFARSQRYSLGYNVCRRWRLKT